MQNAILLIDSPRTARTQSETIPEPCNNEDYWRLVVELSSEKINTSHVIRGGDAIDALLNAMVFLRNTFEEQETRWVRFPNEGDDWHWFRVISPCFGREFDKHLEEVIDREGAEYCGKKDRKIGSSLRVKHETPVENTNNVVTESSSSEPEE